MWMEGGRRGEVVMTLFTKDSMKLKITYEKLYMKEITKGKINNNKTRQNDNNYFV